MFYDLSHVFWRFGTSFLSHTSFQIKPVSHISFPLYEIVIPLSSGC